MFDMVFNPEWSTMKKLIWLKASALASAVYQTVTGAIATFTTLRAAPLRSLAVTMGPKQDLHGYANPWPAGGGKNVLPTLTEAQTVNGVTATPNADGSITLTGTASAIAYFDLIKGFDSTAYAGYIVTGLPDDMASNSSTICYRISTGSSRASLQDIQRGASGAYVSNTIVDNGTNLVFSLRVNNGYALPNGGLTLYPMMRASSASAGFEPYSNICPISGWTGANVTRTGKNFAEIDSAWIGSSGTHNGITWRFNEDGSMTLNGTKTTSTASVLIWNLANAARISGTQSDNKKHIPNGDYYIYSGHAKATLQVYGSNNENAGASNSYGIVSGNLNPVMFTINDTYKYNWIRLNIAGNAVFDNYTFYPMVRLASDTGTEQAPYTGDTYSITFPSEAGTVYSGTVDLVSGLLTINRTTVNTTWGSGINATNLGHVTRKRYNLADPSKKYYTDAENDLKSNIISQYDTLYSGDYVHMYLASTTHIWAYMPRNTAADTVMQFSYTLETPVTYQLTPTEVRALVGINNVWSDADSVTVTYRSN